MLTCYFVVSHGGLFVWALEILYSGQLGEAAKSSYTSNLFTDIRTCPCTHVGTHMPTLTSSMAGVQGVLCFPLHGSFLHHQLQMREVGHLPLPVSRKVRASHADRAVTEQRGSLDMDYFYSFTSGPKMLWFGAFPLHVSSLLLSHPPPHPFPFYLRKVFQTS